MASTRAVKIFAIILALVILSVSFLLPDAQVTTSTYNLNLAVGEVGQVRLPVNPSTGCSWWVESAPSSVDISTSDDVDPTIDCGHPPRLGCSNQVVVYSFKPNEAGEYSIELRYGHAWARNEYYQVAIVHLTVGNSQLSEQVLSGRVTSVESSCGPMTCGPKPLNETNRMCPAMCPLSYRVELIVHLGPPGSLAPDRLYRIYITGGSDGEMRAASLKVGDEVSIPARPAGYCACGAAECNGGDCWLANDSDWRYVGNSTSSTYTNTSGSAETITVTGTVFHGVEAGCWLIRADGTGAEYLLIDAPETLRIDGLPVQVTGEIKTDIASYCMQGRAALQITSYSILSSVTTTTVTVTTTSSLISSNVQPTTITRTLGTTAVIVIPGFPIEAILLGIALGSLMLIVMRLRV
jgi:predicted secreted protein